MQDERAFVERCFVFADWERKGYLAGHDLKCAVAAALGIRPSKLFVAQLFRGRAPAHDDVGLRVTREIFATVISERLQKPDLLEDVRRLFKAMDLRSEGFVSLRSFQQACATALPHASEEMTLRLFREADRDGDGRVTYHDFERLCLLAQQLEVASLQ